MEKTFTGIFILLFLSLCYSQTIDQQLIVVRNDKTVGGQFKVGVQVKGTSLSTANTLGSATIDVNYDNSKLTYNYTASYNSFASILLTNAYNSDAVNNTNFIRIGITGNVSSVRPGLDIGTIYFTWIELNFTIASTSGTTNLTIASGSNAIGLYENHQNTPTTNKIIDQTLSSPIEVSNEPLPVELTSFTADINSNNVNLNWKTATEVNNNGFEIQRAAVRGQRSEVISWEKIGFVEGHGNSNSPEEYSFSDKNLTGGTKFIYRLKQIDDDGQYEYSKELEVEVVPKQFALYQNYPNPFNPTTNIKFDLPEASKVELNVYNILGEKVATLLNKTLEAGYQQVQFNGRDLASGTYIYRIEVSGSGQSFARTKKMLLLK